MSEKQPQEGRQRSMGQRASTLAAILLAIAAVAGWQYTKYANGYGLYRVFGHYGGVVIAASSFVLVVFAAIAVLRER
jgi:hypothetical protein